MIKEIKENIEEVKTEIDANEAKIDLIPEKIEEVHSEVKEVKEIVEDIQDSVTPTEGNTITPYFQDITVKCLHAGILTVGGYGTSGFLSTAEIFNPKTGRSCKIGDIPVATYGLSLCGNLACGGWGSQQSCSRFDGAGTFTALSVTLREERVYHLCWQLQSGEVLLLGGGTSVDSVSTTERLSADGSSSTADFNLPYDIEFVLNLMTNND